MSDITPSLGYNITQEIFKGPIELLLDLIRKKKVEIYQIRISDIIKGFLEYIRSNKDVLLEEISSFLYVAVLLLEYKTRNLLPASSKEEDLEEDTDKSLLLEREREYRIYKNIALHIESLYDKEKYYCVREAPLEKELLDTMPGILDGLTLQKISLLANKLFKERPQEIFDIKNIYDEDIKITVKDEMERITKLMLDKKKHTFRDLSGIYDRIIDKIICFLSILELYKREKIEILQFEKFGNIVIKSIIEA